MPVIVAAIVFVGLLCVFDLALTLAVVRRLREVTARLAEPAPNRSPASRTGVRVGDFTTEDLDGLPVSRESLTGTTAVGIFAVGCATCRERLPEFIAYVGGLGRDGVLAVVTGDLATADTFTERLAPAARVVVEPLNGPVAAALGPAGFPSFYLLDGDGVIVAVERAPGDLPAVASV